MTTTRRARGITPATRLTVLKHLANGKTPEVVAAATKLDRFAVVDIGSHHGYPDQSKIAKAVDLLSRHLEEQARADIPVRPDRPSAGSDAGRAPSPTPRPAPGSAVVPSPASPASRLNPQVPDRDVDVAPRAGEAEAPGVLTRVDEIRVALNAGKQSSSKRTQRLTDRILADVDRLMTLLREEQAKTTARREEEQRKAQLQRKREKLEAELAEVKAELTGRPQHSTRSATSQSAARVSGPTAREIRDWAHRAGVECPTHGRIPGVVREAYDAASTGSITEQASSARGATATDDQAAPASPEDTPDVDAGRRTGSAA